ncbi:recombinase family protein [Boseongicola sp. H5]|uniref:recombinase family protein n=1 Tax=Boseongicola sp. H5 TaxID=2763261 RepID=UPI001D0B0601|nr:recombinase family protein [Boseongicola sp. H5]
MKNYAISYLRTSSAANIGDEKDSAPRQRRAIERCASQRGFKIVAEYNDEAVSGADPIDTRPGFKALLERIAGNGVRTVIVEDPTRFARSLQAAVMGEVLLKSLGVEVICANGDKLFEEEDDMGRAMGQIGFVFAELEKRKVVKRLREGRDARSRALGRRVEGLSRQYSEDLLTQAKALYRKPRKGKRRSLRAISQCLADAGYSGPSGEPYNANSVRQMLTKAGVYQPAA